MAQLTVTLDIPDGKVAELRTLLSTELGYSATIPNPAFNNQLPEDPVTNPATIANPQTRAQYLQVKAAVFLSTWMKNMYKSVKQREAAALADADIDIQ